MTVIITPATHTNTLLKCLHIEFALNYIAGNFEMKIKRQYNILAVSTEMVYLCIYVLAATSIIKC